MWALIGKLAEIASTLAPVHVSESKMDNIRDVDMAKIKIHGHLPEKLQERPFAEDLSCLDFDNQHHLHVWYTRILGTRDIDALLLYEGVGLFVIELKSLWLSAIQEISADNGIRLDPSVKTSTKKPAWLQAIDAAESLQTQICATPRYAPKLKKLWISPAAALFRISRSKFLSRFGSNLRNQHALEQLSSGMIFKEDLSDGKEFLDRLKKIKNNPLYKAKPNALTDLSIFYSAEVAEVLDDFVRWKLEPAETLTATELRRLRRIEVSEEKDLDKVDLSQHVICTGYAGTGKTILGLQMALRKQVPTLFTCYNKVLASDVRRLTSLSDTYSGISFEALDVFHLLADCERRLGITAVARNKNQESWEEYEDRRISKLIEHDLKHGKKLRDLWEFIIVDEGQDISTASWKLIDHLIGTNTVLFAIDGKNQLLYRDEVDQYLREILPALVPESNLRHKRRVFRTTSETFLLGQLFVETYASREKAQEYWNRKLQPQYLRAVARKNQVELDFELSRPTGKAPNVKGLVSRDIGGAVKIVAQSISTAINRLQFTSDGMPSDILILLPITAENSPWRQIAIHACEAINQPYIDYTVEAFRRLSHSPKEIRISTFHSSRGIEALHSIVLGFDCLEEAASLSQQKSANLGYIALTRSAFETEVFCDLQAEVMEARPTKFLRDLIEIAGF